MGSGLHGPGVRKRKDGRAITLIRFCATGFAQNDNLKAEREINKLNRMIHPLPINRNGTVFQPASPRPG